MNLPGFMCLDDTIIPGNSVHAYSFGIFSLYFSARYSIFKLQSCLYILRSLSILNRTHEMRLLSLIVHYTLR